MKHFDTTALLSIILAAVVGTITFVHQNPDILNSKYSPKEREEHQYINYDAAIENKKNQREFLSGDNKGNLSQDSNKINVELLEVEE
ncbi:hypothetical protein K0B04_00975 [Patescibacteria group bacterium]|nr:hypothetical protein [Patescibacteria group bacterium]